jgi:hypothetical protein
MPKKPTDYSKLVIYKIQHVNNPELLYVGSTTDFTKRKNHHKSISHNTNNKKYNIKLYEMIRKNGNWDMFNMVELYKFPCENKRQAECEEDRCIREFKSTLNSQRAFVTPEEIADKMKQYRLEHKDQIAERMRQYYTEHKDEITERNKQYRLEHKDKIAAQKKQYYTEHKDEIKQYYIEHKDELLEYKKQKITCDCGCVIRKDALARHKRSKKHQDLMNSIKVEINNI